MPHSPQATALRSAFEVKLHGKANAFSLMVVALVHEALELTDANFKIITVALGGAHALAITSIANEHFIHVGAMLTMKVPSLAIARHWVEEMGGQHFIVKADLDFPLIMHPEPPMRSFKAQGRRIFSFPRQALGAAAAAIDQVMLPHGTDAWTKGMLSSNAETSAPQEVRESVKGSGVFV